MNECLSILPKKSELTPLLKELIVIAKKQLAIMKAARKRTKNFVLDYYIATTSSFIDNANQVLADGKRSRGQQYAGHNVRTMLEELANVAYVLSLTPVDKERFVIRDIAEACRNFFIVEDDENVKKDLNRLYKLLNKYGWPELDKLKKPVSVISIKQRLISGMGDDGRLYNMYSFLCWLPHSNFFYLHQKEILDRGGYRRDLMEAVTFMILYIKKMNGPCGGATTDQIEGVLKRYEHTINKTVPPDLEG